VIKMKKQITNKDALRVIAWWAYDFGANNVSPSQFDKELEQYLNNSQQTKTYEQPLVVDNRSIPSRNTDKTADIKLKRKKR